ncbi:hypothetical protein H2198_002983 [Neophaeococcomyces mojaviensis]|uniref:Uncharacterized protein n=1 Tax=Neophaeococcomyces mojaviensis TaxID=3383035 RepID=A0ACC3ACP0_9EURO|nr:hypothetical protein H2198_002983 [Knufia sp. JES_112]
MVPPRGGLVVYYFMNDINNTVPTFPPDFRMISGDADHRDISVPIPDPPKLPQLYEPYMIWQQDKLLSTPLARSRNGCEITVLQRRGLGLQKMPHEEWVTG